MNARRRNLLFPLSIGVTGFAVLLNAVSKPGVAALRAVDVLQLIASGMCFGVALAKLIGALRNRGSS